MVELNTFTFIDDVRLSRGKQARARSIRGRMQQRMVRFPKFAHWWPQAEAELLSFDKGKHDDFVDALAHIGCGIDQMFCPKQEVKPVYGRYTLGWLKETRRRQEYAAALRM